ncbi:MAG: type II secretion system F family protein [Lachnospiraceae bacterium]|nr:type II secretion system F family protein [Lachnospiraceae bacterium]
MLLAGFFAGRTERLTQLNRPDVGEGEKNVSFTVKPDGMEEWLYEGTIAPRIYSARELDELMDGAKKYIDENLFYEGESANEVISGLNLIKEAPAGPVAISWEGEALSLFEKSGVRKEEFYEVSGVCYLTARLSCQDYICYYDIPIKTGVKILTGEEIKKKAISNALDERLSKSGEEAVSLLPETVDNIKIGYETQKSNSFAALGLLLFVLPAIYVAKLKEDEKQKIKDKETELLHSYSDLIGKFVILLGAGMNVYNIFGKIAEEYEQRLSKTKTKEYLYEEVLITFGELKSGVYEKTALDNFGRRIGLLPYIRFASILTQNLKEGTAGIIKRLEDEQQNALKERKALATRMGERLETKILFPMLLELVIVMMIIMVPAFMSM